MLEIRQLEKHYKGFQVGPIDLCIEAGSATALIGANGAGKTTLFRSLIGVVSPDRGTVTLAGQQCDPAQGLWRQQLGYLGDYQPFFDRWTGERNLSAIARFYPSWSHDYALQLASRLQLNLQQKAHTYSTGQRTKLALISALAHKPKLLLLDEPANGLDPVSRDEFLTVLFEHLEDGDTALLYATHHISELEGLADRLVFFHEGRIYDDVIKEDILESWRLLTFTAEKEMGGAPHLQSLMSELPGQKLLSSNYEATLDYLRQQGVRDVEATRLSTDQIVVQILKAMLREGGQHV